MGATGVPVKVGSANGAFKAKSGTVGLSEVPPRSPANCIKPLLKVVASGAPDATVAST